jgi:hypothetical protein
MQLFTHVHRHPTGQPPKFEGKKKNHYWSVMHISTIVVTVELHKDQIHTCALKCMKLVVYSNNSWQFVINYTFKSFYKDQKHHHHHQLRESNKQIL